MSATTKVLLALIIGVILGALGAKSATEIAVVTDAANVIGTLWINAIRMTVIPLVAALTVTAVANIGDAKQVGRLGGIAVLTFVVLLVASGVFAMLVAPLSIDRLVLSPEAAANLQAKFSAQTGAVAPALPSLGQRIIDMVPVNPLKAAADGAILPVVVFSLAFGLALARVAPERRNAAVSAFTSIGDAMLVLVGWVLRLAPLGVFALAFVLGVRAGLESVTALVHYVVTMCVVMFAYTLLLYPIAIIIGRVSPVSFIKAALPAQAVAFSVRSSLAALPAMITAARDTLKLPSSSTGFVLPLAVSVFRLNVPIAWIIGVLFLGKLYGVEITEGQLAMLVVTSTLLSFSVPGIPSGSLFLLSPVLVQNGLPAEGVGILIALDAIPDMFKTLANVTAHMTSAVVVARWDPERVTAAASSSPAP